MKRAVRFKAKPDVRAVVLTPDGISKIVIGDRLMFESVMISEGDQAMKVFLEKIISGRLSLYLYNGSQYFIKKGDERFQEVTKRRRLRSDEKVQTSYSGLGLFKLATMDCPSYNEQFLVDQYSGNVDYELIVRKYNECFNEVSVPIRRVSSASKLSFGVHASVAMTKLDYAKAPTMSGFTFEPQLGATAGVFLSLFHPALGDNLNLVFEPGFGTNNSYSYFRDVKQSNDLFIRYSYLRAPLLLRYTSNNFFVDLGLSNFFVISQRNTWRKEDESATVVTTFDGPDYKLEGSRIGFAAGFGGVFKIGDRPLHTSLRFTNVFRHNAKFVDQPSVKWLELNVGFQLTK